MEAIKIENYEREHGAGSFVSFRHLSKKEADHKFGLLRQRLESADELDALQVVSLIRNKGVVVEGVDATRDDFDLKYLLNQLKFDVADTLFLNWYRFDKIDELRTDDVCAKFTDIWYSSSDDLDVFDSNIDWLLSIEHNGTVRALSLRRR